MPPRRALVPRKRVRARDFLSEIGKLMEPDQWTTSWIDSLQKNQVVGDDQFSRTALYVVNQLIEAVRLGIAEPEVRLTDQQQAELTPVNSQEPSALTDQVRLSSDELLDALDETLLWPEESECSLDWSAEFPDTEPGFYKVDKEFWDADNVSLDVNWTTSLIRVPVRFIITDRRETVEARMKRVGMSDVNNAILYFRNPDAIISRLTDIPPAPSQALLERYTSTQTYFWSELIAATWRFVAIEQPDLAHGVGERLIKYLHHYAEMTGLWEPGEGPTPSMMNTVVSQIIRQWEAEATDQSVLVSPSLKKLPPKRPKSDGGR